jgi:DNA-binding NtrC family response regulator
MGSLVDNVQATLPPEHILFGRSEAMEKIRSSLERLTATSVSVLLEGESGTGKAVIAHLIHSRSPWAAGPFLRTNCAVLSGAALDSELLA